MCRRVKSFAQSHEAGKFGIQTWVYLSSKKKKPAVQEMQFDSWVGKISWRRAWQPTPVFLPGQSCGQSRLQRARHDGSNWTHTYTLYTLLDSQASVLNSTSDCLLRGSGSLHPKGILWFWAYFPTISRQTPTLWSLISQFVLTHNVVS